MEKRVLGVLAGNDTPASMLKFWAEKAHILIAADRGGDHLVAAGFSPNVVLGDWDSSELDPDSIAFDIHKFEDQDYSDCDKLLSFAQEQGHDAITMIGFEGDRIDHVLASLGSFLRSPLDIRIAIRHGLAHVVKKPETRLFPSYAGQTVSILPILPSSGVTTTGLQWEVQDASLEFGSFLSLSNVAKGESFTVQLGRGALLVVQEFDATRLPEW